MRVVNCDLIPILFSFLNTASLVYGFYTQVFGLHMCIQEVGMSLWLTRDTILTIIKVIHIMN